MAAAFLYYERLFQAIQAYEELQSQVATKETEIIDAMQQIITQEEAKGKKRGDVAQWFLNEPFADIGLSIPVEVVKKVQSGKV